MSLNVHLALVFHVFIAVAIVIMVCGHHGTDPAPCLRLKHGPFILFTLLSTQRWQMVVKPVCVYTGEKAENEDQQKGEEKKIEEESKPEAADKADGN